MLAIIMRKRSEEEYWPYCISPTVKHPPSIMLLICAAANSISRLELVSDMMNATNYIEILETKMLSSVHSLFSDDNRIFQDENASCHRVKKFCTGTKPINLKESIGLPDLQI